MSALLDIRDLTVTYRSERGEVPAVRGVSLAIDAGETIGIAGESGSGKSTMAQAVLRLHPRSVRVSGQVFVDGQDVNSLSWGALRRMRWSDAAMVFQGAMHSLNPVLTVGEQIAEPVLIHAPATTAAAAQRRVAELLDSVGLTAEHAATYPHQLSGGQKQRVMIAMALACNPKLLVADEPTTALDVKVQAQIMRLLHDLVRDLDLGLLLISHDLAVLSAVCDTVLVMHGGRVIEHGNGRQLFRSPRHPYTRALAGAFPTIGDPASRYRPQGRTVTSAEEERRHTAAFLAQCRTPGGCLVHRAEFARFARGTAEPCHSDTDLGVTAPSKELTP